MSMGPRTHTCLTVLCISTSFVEIWESTRRLIGGVKGVLVGMGLLLVNDDECAESNESQLSSWSLAFVVYVGL